MAAPDPLVHGLALPRKKRRKNLMTMDVQICPKRARARAMRSQQTRCSESAGCPVPPSSAWHSQSLTRSRKARAQGGGRSGAQPRRAARGKKRGNAGRRGLLGMETTPPLPSPPLPLELCDSWQACGAAALRIQTRGGGGGGGSYAQASLPLTQAASSGTCACWWARGLARARARALAGGGRPRAQPPPRLGEAWLNRGLA